jgi:hypothetical protein
VLWVAYGKQIRLESTKAERFEIEGYVGGHWVGRHEPREANEVYGPHVVVLDAIPEHLERKCLPIVHVTLGGIVT